MHTVKVSREKDVDLLFAGLKRNSEAVTRIGAWWCSSSSQPLLLTRKDWGRLLGAQGVKKI